MCVLKKEVLLLFQRCVGPVNSLMCNGLGTESVSTFVANAHLSKINKIQFLVCFKQQVASLQADLSLTDSITDTVTS
jgi:hypothetical protein